MTIMIVLTMTIIPNDGNDYGDDDGDFDYAENYD